MHGDGPRAGRLMHRERRVAVGAPAETAEGQSQRAAAPAILTTGAGANPFGTAGRARLLAALSGRRACQPGALLLKFSLGLPPAQSDVAIEQLEGGNP